jgi:mRNA interferase HigB
MHVITQKRIWDAKLRFPNCASALEGWYRIIKKNNFTGFNDLKKVFSSLDKVNDYYVFDIGGNKLRLIAIIFFERQKVFIQEILSHAEYDKRNLSK